MINMSNRFHGLFVFGLLISIAQMITAIAACFVTNARQTCNYWTQIAMFIISFTYLLAVTGIRLSHAGEVCSGDYLLGPVSIETRKAGILGLEG